MKIKILQNSEWHFGKYLSDNYVLETTEYDGEFESVKGIRYSLLNLETNERIEVLPILINITLEKLSMSRQNLNTYILQM